MSNIIDFVFTDKGRKVDFFEKIDFDIVNGLTESQLIFFMKLVNFVFKFNFLSFDRIEMVFPNISAGEIFENLTVLKNREFIGIGESIYPCEHVFIDE